MLDAICQVEDRKTETEKISNIHAVNYTQLFFLSIL